MIKTNELHLIGCASGLAGADINSGKGPLVVQQSSFLVDLLKKNIRISWDEMLQVSSSINLEKTLHELYMQLANKVADSLHQKKKTTVIGGDHSCAIGTWSGAYQAYKEKGDIGLIWIDAHMDSHTPETSESGRIHGMPLACLLGFGSPLFTHIFSHAPKIKPENLCLIGVRNFESGEEALLKRLNVRIYYMDEVRERGVKTILSEAVDLVNQCTIGYGLSIDMDSMDPAEVPGVDVPEPNGIHVNDLYDGLAAIASDPRLILTEIVEFDPLRDKNRMTEKVFVTFLEILATS